MEHTSTWKVQFSCVHIIVAFLKKIINLCIYYRTSQVGHTRSRYILRSLFTLCVRWNNSKRLSIVVRASSFWYRLPLQEPMHTKDCHAYTTHNLLKATMLLSMCVCWYDYPRDHCWFMQCGDGVFLVKKGVIWTIFHREID
jgi:hypothetical protein